MDLDKLDKTMGQFKNYKRKQIAELRHINQFDIGEFKNYNMIIVNRSKDNIIKVSISDEDLKNGSPKIGDMVARNPKNHLDQWLVAKKYFKDNFEPA